MYVNMAIKNCQIYKGMFKSVDTILVNTRASPFIILLQYGSKGSEMTIRNSSFAFQNGR